ncbi:hypothetical protein ACOSP7_022754 [Xanthoceras sorbifolium]
MVGFGVVIRDSNGSVMPYCSKRIETCNSPDVAEAKAILYGMNLALEASLLLVVVESDSSSVISLIRLRNIICAVIGLILADIINLGIRTPSIASFFLLRIPTRLLIILPIWL